MSYYEKDLEKILCGMYLFELSNRLGKAIENVMGEKEDMYYVYYVIGENEHQTMVCKRVHLRTDLNILNVLTKDNEYKMLDLKYVTYLDILKMKEEKDETTK